MEKEHEISVLFRKSKGMPDVGIMYTHNNHCHRVTAHLQSNILLLLLLCPSDRLFFWDLV